LQRLRGFVASQCYHHAITTTGRCPVSQQTTDRQAFVVRMPASQHAQLRELAERSDRSMSSVVRIAVQRFLEEELDRPSEGAA